MRPGRSDVTPLGLTWADVTPLGLTWADVTPLGLTWAVAHTEPAAVASAEVAGAV